MTVPTYPSLVGLHLPIKRTPEWDTDVQISIGGRRTAFARRAYPRYIWELTYQFLRSDSTNVELQTLQAFYNRVNGRAGLFQYTDPEDNTATAQSIGSGDGNTTTFQLVRAMTGTGSNTFIEPVFAPAAGIQIFNNAVLQTLGVDYTVSNLGLITFTVAPVAGNPLTWSGQFSYYCRFESDSADFEKMFATAIWEIKRVVFSSELF
jgi:uncharacterized protein (TIGR02217 family)